MQTLVHEHQFTAVYWNRCYEPDAIARDKHIKHKFQELAVDCQSFNGSLLIEPWQHLKKDETPYRVFTPFWKALSSRLDYFESKSAPKKLPAIPAAMMRDALGIDALNLLPDIAWDKGLRASWQPGEAGAHAQLEKFVEEVMIDYPGGRDIPGKAGTSRLSPHLHFGEIPKQPLFS